MADVLPQLQVFWCPPHKSSGKNTFDLRKHEGGMNLNVDLCAGLCASETQKT